MRSFEYGGVAFEVWDGVYEPSEDSFMLLRAAMEQGPRSVFEVGTGCGFISILLRQNGCPRVIATDISSTAVLCAQSNARRLGTKLDLVVSDMFSAIVGKFDLVVFNPPYLPVDPEGLESANWAGGAKGRRLIDAFIAGLGPRLHSRGTGLLVQSSLNEPSLTRAVAAGHHLKSRVVSEQSFFFERLQVVELSR